MGLLESYYLELKIIHVTCVVASGSLFILRGIWLIQQSNQLLQRWVRVAPHAIDTVLLLSAIMLSIALQQYPITHGWLTAKVLALLVYIGLGMVALHHHRSRQMAIASWVAALLVYAYIVITAISHSVTLGY